jgi:hypothetical protein
MMTNDDVLTFQTGLGISNRLTWDKGQAKLCLLEASKGYSGGFSESRVKNRALLSC